MKTDSGLPLGLLVLLPSLVKLISKTLVHKTPEQLVGGLVNDVRRQVPEELRPVVAQTLAELAAQLVGD